MYITIWSKDSSIQNILFSSHDHFHRVFSHLEEDPDFDTGMWFQKDIQQASVISHYADGVEY